MSVEVGAKKSAIASAMTVVSLALILRPCR